MAGHSAFQEHHAQEGPRRTRPAPRCSPSSRAKSRLRPRSARPIPAMNPRLRLAIQAARAENMPKDNIERAIKKAAGGDADTYEAIRYEGYAPGRRRRHRRGADRQPQPHRRRGARRVHQVRRQPRRDGLGRAHVRARRRDHLSGRAPARPMRCWRPRSRRAPTTCISDADGHVIVCAFDSLGTGRRRARGEARRAAQRQGGVEAEPVDAGRRGERRRAS